MRKEGSGKWNKITKWLDALEEVINNEELMFLSNNDILYLVNSKLEKKEQITRRTLHKWVNKVHENISEEEYQRFEDLFSKTQIKQKQFLFKKMMESNDKSWTKYAWIMERKFSDFNLKQITENINKNEDKHIIQIVGKDDEQLKLIDSIVNGNSIDAIYYEIPPTPIEGKTNSEKSINNNEDEDKFDF